MGFQSEAVIVRYFQIDRRRARAVTGHLVPATPDSTTQTSACKATVGQTCQGMAYSS